MNRRTAVGHMHAGFNGTRCGADAPGRHGEILLKRQHLLEGILIGSDGARGPLAGELPQYHHAIKDEQKDRQYDDELGHGCARLSTVQFSKNPPYAHNRRLRRVIKMCHDITHFAIPPAVEGPMDAERMPNTAMSFIDSTTASPVSVSEPFTLPIWALSARYGSICIYASNIVKLPAANSPGRCTGRMRAVQLGCHISGVVPPPNQPLEPSVL